MRKEEGEGGGGGKRGREEGEGRGGGDVYRDDYSTGMAINSRHTLPPIIIYTTISQYGHTCAGPEDIM